MTEESRRGRGGAGEGKEKTEGRAKEGGERERGGISCRTVEQTGNRQGPGMIHSPGRTVGDKSDLNQNSDPM